MRVKTEKTIDRKRASTRSSGLSAPAIKVKEEKEQRIKSITPYKQPTPTDLRKIKIEVNSEDSKEQALILLDANESDPSTRSADDKKNLVPDIDDLKNYCKVCKRSYKSRIYYRLHLRVMHEVKLPHYKTVPVTAELSPDVNDPDFTVDCARDIIAVDLLIACTCGQFMK